MSPTSQFNYAYGRTGSAPTARRCRRRTHWTWSPPPPTCSGRTTGSTTSTTTSASPRRPATSRPTAATRCSGLVHAGAASGGAPTYTGRDNAYMLTLPDGIPSWSGMFLWEPINDAFEGPYSDGNFDRSVIQHEYTHGLSTRYVAGGDGARLRTSPARWVRAGATGTRLNHLTVRACTPRRSSVSTHRQPVRGIRNWAYDENPTSSVTSATTSPVPRCTPTARSGPRRSGTCARSWWRSTARRRAPRSSARLVTDAMPLSAPDPSFLDMRDAHPGGRPRPQPRRQLRHDLDRLRPARRRCVGVSRDRRRHRAAARVRPRVGARATAPSSARWSTRPPARRSRTPR